MLSAEVHKFESPQSSQNIDRKASNVQVLKTIQSFPFPHLVQLTIPDILKVPENITRIFSNSRYYKIRNFALGDLINRAFISCFIKRGSLTLLSLGTRIDCDNCVAVTPEGYLILNIDKDTFQSLSLEGKVSHFHSKSKNRFVVTVDLNSEYLRPGKSFYDRTKLSLNKLGKFTVILKWEQPISNPEICPSSIAKYFANLSYDVSYSELVYNANTADSVRTPILDFEKCDDDEVKEFSEWLGMVSLNCDLNESSEDNYLSNYAVPEPNAILSQVNVLQWRGLFSTRQVESFLDAVREFAESKEEPWVSMYVQGFSDSPVGWRNEEHHHYINGDNSYLIIAHKNGYITCTQGTSRKLYK